MVTETLQNSNFTFAVNLSLHPPEVDKLNIAVNSWIALWDKARICLFSKDTHTIVPSIRSYHPFCKCKNPEEETNVKFAKDFSFSFALHGREYFYQI